MKHQMIISFVSQETGKPYLKVDLSCKGIAYYDKKSMNVVMEQLNALGYSNLEVCEMIDNYNKHYDKPAET